MKLLIVTAYVDERRTPLSTIAATLGAAECKVVSHDEALAEFLEMEPTHVLVCEYEENAGAIQGFVKGKTTWKDLSASALPTQRLVRCGFMNCAAADFLRMPFSVDGLRTSLGV